MHTKSLVSVCCALTYLYLCVYVCVFMYVLCACEYIHVCVCVLYIFVCVCVGGVLALHVPTLIFHEYTWPTFCGIFSGTNYPGENEDPYMYYDLVYVTVFKYFYSLHKCLYFLNV